LRRAADLPRLLLVLYFALSCATSQAPRGFLPTASESQQEAYGGWIVIDVPAGQYAGELIAISPSEVDVLEPIGPRLVRVPMADISKMHLEAYRTQAGKLSLWTALGALSTFGNGVFLIFTAPIFIIVGSISAAYESRAAFLEYPGNEFDQAWKFARFPQGMPPGVDECVLIRGSGCTPPDAAEREPAPLPDAGPPPDAAPTVDALPRPQSFEFSSDGPYHQSGKGEWVITIRGNDVKIAHNFRMFESRETGPLALTDAELRTLWIRLANAGLDNLPPPPKSASDESIMTFTLDGRKVRALASDARQDPAVRKLLVQLELLVERYAGEHPNLQ
jgi:hypothetical protein